MKLFIKWLVLPIVLGMSVSSWAAANIDITSPAVVVLMQSMQARYSQLASHYNSGIVGLTTEGFIEIRDDNALPLFERKVLTVLVAAENQDRNALYIEIARMNGHPEWEEEVHNLFAQRWIQRAQGGWWIHGSKGWFKK